MPMRKLPEETVTSVVELLLCGWTPQQIVECWPARLIGPTEGVTHPVGSPLSLVSVQRIAKAEGLARPKGGPAGREYHGGGAPKGHAAYDGSGRPRGSQSSPHRAEVRRLRDEGHSLRVIAGFVGLRSPQQVANLLVED